MADQDDVVRLRTRLLDDEWVAKYGEMFDRMASRAAHAYLNGGNKVHRDLYEQLSHLSAMSIDDLRDWMLDRPAATAALIEELDDLWGGL